MSSCVCLRWTARAGLAGACAVKSVMSAVRHTTRTGRRRKQSALNCSLQTLDNTAVIVAVTHAHVDKATLLWVTLHGFDMKSVVGFPLALFVCLFVCYLHYIYIVVSACNYRRWPAMMEFFLSGSLPLIEFVICDVMSDMANKLLYLSLSLSLSLSCRTHIVCVRCILASTKKSELMPMRRAMASV